jgi:peptide/nickel transport system substrate-binding protein
MRSARAIAAGLAVAALAALASGCGSDGASPIAAAGAEPQPRGAITIAVPAPPHELDPLLARTPVDRLVTGQLYEPLVERLSGPYDDVRQLPGLAVSVQPAEGGRVWRIRLRSGIRFQDGSPFEASAVVANAERWRTTAAGQALLPGLATAGAPRPDLVRLSFDPPLPDLRRRLASPRLGIVSPSALRPPSGIDARLASSGGAGTGAFTLRSGTGASAVLARNTGWWGTPMGLGPAFDQIGLRVVPSANQRLRLLRRGDVEAAWGLPAAVASRLRRDPLLSGLPAPGGASIGLERSVRGIEAANPPPRLSAVWLTRIVTG